MTKPTPAWLNPNIAVALQPPLPSLDGLLPANRNAAALDVIIDMFEVETAERYRRRKLPGLGEKLFTFCNVFSSDVAAALGADIPHRLNGEWQDVNANMRWLRTGHGGWGRCTGIEAQTAANAGRPTVVGFEGGEHGHIAVVRPSRGRVGIWIAQAGAFNHNFAPLLVGFGKYVANVEFFTHA